MPPPKPKSNKANPNQHDKRHESGLAAPGKKVTKQRSNGQLNGQPNGSKPASSVPAPALPSTGLNSGFRFSHSTDTPADITTQTISTDDVAASSGMARDRTSSEASIEDAGLNGNMADGTDTAPTSPTLEAHAAALKTSTPPSGGALSAVSTILTYYPLRDAISILILLLSLPPTLVLVIQALFASLTFVPPTAGISLSTLPNIKEMFNASNLGYPALATILIVDLIFWVCWLPVWKPIQSIFLDLSQAVIAISLSGAAAGSGGPTYSIVSSSIIVCVVHVLRYKAIHLTALDYLRSVIHKMDIGMEFDVPPIATSFVSSIPIERGWVFTIIRTMLGIHIVSQGITTCIRRSLVKANERDQNTPAISKTDPEAATASDSATRSGSGHGDGVQQLHNSTNPEGRVSVQSPAPREGKSRESNSRKKKKQANRARSQQPLWAAIASTKVTFVKEMEYRDAADDARDAGTMDYNTPITLSGLLNASENRIWFNEIRPTEIVYTVDLNLEALCESSSYMAKGITIPPGIDKTKPFYLRVNGASWSSTRIEKCPVGDGSDKRCDDRFDGEAYGLAPMSSYRFEIIGIATGEVFCFADVITSNAPSAVKTTIAPVQAPPPALPALRPASPITTLKQSILSAEAKLNETRNRTRKTKKDQRGAHSDLRKEINSLKQKLESSGGTDDKQERRLMQITQHKNQAEEATADLKEQMDALGEVPSDEVKELEAKRRVWQSAHNAKASARKDLDNAKAEADRELATLKTDISHTGSKREKLSTRKTQRATELEKLATKQHADMTAKQQRDAGRAQINAVRQEEDNQIRNLFNAMENEYQVISAKTQETYLQIAALQSWNTHPNGGYRGYSSPPTPEGTHASTVNGFQAYAQPGFPSAFQFPQPMVPQTAPRGRSSSMLSQYSGFTDEGDDDMVYSEVPQHPQNWPMHPSAAIAGAAVMDDRKESEGSGSNTNDSTGSNSPRPDAKPFVPTKMNPIGPPSRGKEKMSYSPAFTARTVDHGR